MLGTYLSKIYAANQAADITSQKASTHYANSTYTHTYTITNTYCLPSYLPIVHGPNDRPTDINLIRLNWSDLKCSILVLYLSICSTILVNTIVCMEHSFTNIQVFMFPCAKKSKLKKKKTFRIQWDRHIFQGKLRLRIWMDNWVDGWMIVCSLRRFSFVQQSTGVVVG